MGDITRLNVTPRYSDATIFKGRINFVEIPEKTENLDITQQTLSLLNCADKTLAACNSDKSRILQATIYITDFANLQTFNAIWDKWLITSEEKDTPFSSPSRACVKVELVDPNMLIEIAFVAAQRE